MHYLKCITFNILFLFTLLLSDVSSFAQSKLSDSIERKMVWYSLKKSPQTLFAHFDKTVYAQNENIWFTAYLLNKRNIDNPGVLAVSLVNDLDRKMVFEQKFLMAAGISFGNIFLADTIPPGSYSLMLYANNLFKGKPVDVFIQHITVAATNTAAFNVAINLDTLEGENNIREAVLHVNTRDGRPIPGAVINYTIGDSKLQLVKASAKTLDDGKYRIHIPIGQINSDDNILQIQAEYNKEVEKVRLLIPFNKENITVKFYPEGGYLIDGANCTVGWEAKTKDEAPVAATGVLYKNNKPVDTIRTDSYGMGRFRITPIAGCNYSVKLVMGRFRDSVFKLQKVLPSGTAISLNNALANDTLKLKLISKKSEQVTLLVHNYRQIFYAVPVNVSPTGKTVLINLKIIRKGLATVSILDSMGRPVCERLFFAHYNKRSIIDIQTDKPQYKKREKVTLSLKFKTPDTGLVSVACVQSNRIQIKNKNDIESYIYLKHELGNLPLKENYISNSKEDLSYLENLLLIKGWRRYTWQEMIQTTTQDTMPNAQLLSFNGKVTHSGKLLKKPMRLIVMTDSATTTVKTDQAGGFTLSNNTIITGEDKKVHFWPMAASKDDYEVRITDPYTKINKKLTAELTYRSSQSNVSNNNLELKGLEHAIALKELKIKALKDNSLLNSFSKEVRLQTENECGDYICMFGIFNCPNHKGFANNTIPIEGQYYLIRGQMTRYSGCVVPIVKNKNAELLNTIQGIKYSKEFYGSDYSVLNPSQPEYYSTIFWKNLLRVNAQNTAQLSFYTSDITGSFKVIVEGITQNDVVHKEIEFSVK